VGPSPTALTNLIGGEKLSRIYEGRWRVLLICERPQGDEYAYTEPDTYEECEKRLLLHGMLGVPFEGKRINSWSRCGIGG
jgi:hypothetical protein